MIFAKDLPRMTAFYRDHIGLTVTSASETYVEFDTGETVFALHAIPAEIAARIEISEPPRPRENNPVKLTFKANRTAPGTAVDPEGNVFGLE